MSRLFPKGRTLERPAKARIAYRVCCVVCGFPADCAVHLPPMGAYPGTPAYDHEFVEPRDVEEQP